MYMDPGRECRQTDRQTDRQTETETDRQTDTERDRERQKQRQRQRDRGLKERWTHMYDKQIQLKSDNASPDCLDSSSLALQESPKCSRIAVFSCVYF